MSSIDRSGTIQILIHPLVDCLYLRHGFGHFLGRQHMVKARWMTVFIMHFTQSTNTGQQLPNDSLWQVGALLSANMTSGA